jgi:DNA topoisomerase-1
MKLVIVESPAKCGKIQSFLGEGYRVVATMGHIRALEEKLDAVGIDREWEPRYEEIGSKRDAIAKLRRESRGAEVILATDDDREGEGIAWHVCALLRLDPATTPRIVFHEITRPAILAAVAAPRTLDLQKVNAQQARAMLDMLVGFTISKVLWNRVAPKLSAGRCQTPALRLVVERDAEVENHKASAFWRLSATTATPHGARDQLLEIQANEDIETESAARAVLQTVYDDDRLVVDGVKESVSTSAPPKPLITSTLQQEASTNHGLNPKATMNAAQKLYEAGHITYMRTDNPQLSAEAAEAIRVIVCEKYGMTYVGTPGLHTVSVAPAAASKGKKKSAPAAPAPQAAHEAIRPTHPEHAEAPVDDHIQQTVYRLIWRRAMQSQMAPSQTDVRRATLHFEAESSRVWSAEQTKIRFAGWRVLERGGAAHDAAAWETWAPYLRAGARLYWTALHADEMFTKPRGRFTEASLVAELEKRGIGRPSTFATLVSTIVDREYVERTNVEGAVQVSRHLVVKPHASTPTETTQTHRAGAERNKLRSTALGRSVADFLGREYSDLFNYEFTAAMESDLDAIAAGAKPWKSLLQSTWDTYKDRYLAATTGASARAAARAAKERVLDAATKVIQSRKGPLFVREPPPGSPAGTKATFAPLPSSVTFDAATLTDATAAFAAAETARAGELIGADADGREIRKKRGPYGFYAECNGVRVPLRGGEPLETVLEKLAAKSTSAATTPPYERRVGDYTIKRGPYGLYFFKHTLKKANFVKFPPALDPETIVAADLNALYTNGLAAKRRGGRKFTKKDDTP